MAANYKALHNKLSYMKRSHKDSATRAHAQEALEKLIDDKEEMISKFISDQSLQWITTLKKTESTEASDSTNAHAEWFNRGQMIRELAMENMTKELQDSELSRYVSEPHPNPHWAKVGERQWKLVKITEIKSQIPIGGHEIMARNATLPSRKIRPYFKPPLFSQLGRPYRVSMEDSN